jgi:hypothetical protein
VLCCCQAEQSNELLLRGPEAALTTAGLRMLYDWRLQRSFFLAQQLQRRWVPDTKVAEELDPATPLSLWVEPQSYMRRAGEPGPRALMHAPTTWQHEIN